MSGVKDFVVGAIAIGASFIPGIGGLASSLLLAYGTTRLAAGLANNLADKQQGVEFNVASNVAPLPIVYGKAKLGLLYADIRVDPASTNNDTLYIVGCLCHGSVGGLGIEAIDEIYLDDVLAVNAAGTVQAPFSGKLTVTKYLGTASQSVDSAMNTKFPTEWPSTSKGRGVAYLVLKLTADPTIYPTGIPNVTAIVRGRKVYDPRILAYAYSTNPVLCLRDYLTDTDAGAAASASGEIVEQSFIDEANYCEDLVTITGPSTSQMRFECNGIVDTGQDPKENLRQLATGCRGNLVWEGGQVRIFIRKASVPQATTLTEQTIVGGWQFTLAGIKDAPNLARVTYIDPLKNYQPDVVEWPRPGATNSYLTEDNGFDTALDIELPFTVDRYTAEQIAMVSLKEARKGVLVRLQATEDLLAVAVGDTVELTHDTPGWTDKEFWLMSTKLGLDGSVGLGLMEYDVNAYTLDAQATYPSLPGTDLPDPFTCAAPTGLTLSADPDANAEGYVARIKATWTRAAEPFLDYYEIQTKLDSDSTWSQVGVALRDDTQFLTPPLTEMGDWDFQIRAVNTLGVPSAWVSGSVSTGMLGKVLRFSWSNLSKEAGWPQGLYESTDLTLDCVKIVNGAAPSDAMHYAGSFQIPKGVTITAFTAKLYKSQAGSLAKAILYKDGVALATCTHTATPPATETVTTACSQLVGDETYSVRVELQAATTGHDVRFHYCEVEYETDKPMTTNY